MFVDLPERTLSTFSWIATYISNRGQFFLIFCTTIIFREMLELYYFETQKKAKPKIFCYQKQYRHSLRKVGDSLKEHSSHPPFYLSNIIVFYIINVYILIICHALCQTYVCMILERTSYKCKTCVQSYCIYMTIKYV